MCRGPAVRDCAARLESAAWAAMGVPKVSYPGRRWPGVVELTPTNLAVAAAAIVAALSLLMAYWGYRAYKTTENIRLLFVVLAFITFVIKSLFVAYNVKYHAVQHDSIELVSTLFDLLIVLILFLPFLGPGKR